MTLAVLIYRADTYQSAFLLLVPLVPYIGSKIVRNRSEAILFETISSFCCCWLVWDFKMWTEHDECFGCDLWRNSWTEIENAILLTLISNYIKVIMGRRVWRRYSNDVSQTLSRITTDTKKQNHPNRQYETFIFRFGLEFDERWFYQRFFFSSFFLMRSFISETNENLVGRATHLFLNENHNNNADDFH